jgi:uncharacterized membrane protein YbhN (UPF0104 family)
VTALAVGSQGAIILLWFVLARSAGFGLPLGVFVWGAPVVTLSGVLPLTFAGLGVREGLWLILLSGAGIASADVVAFSLLYFVCNVIVGLAGGFVFIGSGVAPTTTGHAAQAAIAREAGPRHA